MRIRRVRATPVTIPLEAPYKWVFGELDGFSKTIVEVETTDGIVGLGESPSWSHASLIERMGEAIAGLDPVDIACCEERCVPHWQPADMTSDFARVSAFGAIELALWDIRGKAWGRPLYELLGGAVRTEIPFTDYFAFRGAGDGVGGEATPQAVADYCQRLHEEHGTTFFEGKLSDQEPAAGIAMVRAIRERLGPKVMLRVDSNHAYSLATARMVAPQLEALGVRNWEDPVRTFEEQAELRRHTRIPFSSHNVDLRRAVALRVPDAIVTEPTIHGGIGRFVRFVGAAEQMGVDVWCYSGDSGVMSAAYLHLGAALAHLREPSQSLFRMQPLDVIEEGPFRPRRNTVPVPTGPGLGVTLSAAGLARAHRLFVERGPANKYHDPDRPGTFRRLPLV